MSYLTNYEIEFRGAEEDANSCDCEFDREISNFCPMCGASNKKISTREKLMNEIFDIVGYDPFEEDCKWYDHNQDMMIISIRYPNILFVLNGIGEEYGDFWKKYYKNGGVQTCQAEISYDKFDEFKLKEI